jgi:hypothetical protein
MAGAVEDADVREARQRREDRRRARPPGFIRIKSYRHSGEACQSADLFFRGGVSHERDAF